MEFDCKCCGHTKPEETCECPNRPGDFDRCHPHSRYRCQGCGRGYSIAQRKNARLPDPSCPSSDCDGKLFRVGNRRFPTKFGY